MTYSKMETVDTYGSGNIQQDKSVVKREEVVDIEGCSDYVQSEELKKLALYFFKEKGMTARESYNHASSFLNIKKNIEGKDIVNVEVQFFSVLWRDSESDHDSPKFYLRYFDGNYREESCIKLTILGQELYISEVNKALEDFILKNMIPKRLLNDNSKVLKVKLVEDQSTMEKCKHADAQIIVMGKR